MFNNILNIKCRTLISTLLILALYGCDTETNEKSYSYYVEHPAELKYDYEYCKNRPSKLSCHHVVKKYVQYQRATGITYGEAKDGSAFFDIDAPTNCGIDIDKPL